MRRILAFLTASALLASGAVALISAAPTAAAPYAAPPSVLATGQTASCAITAAGGAACWGHQLYGQLGNGESSGYAYSPTPASGLISGVVGVTVGDGHGCAVTTAGAARCWGDNYRGSRPLLGRGLRRRDRRRRRARAAPTTVSGLASGVRSISLGNGHGCVVQQYTDLLAKAPTTTARNTWVTKLEAAAETPGTFLAALRADPDQVSTVDPTARLYFAYFLRIPDKSGLDYWIKKKRSGVPLRTISDSFASSSEFTRRYGSLSNAGFVDLIYLNLFQRQPDAAGKAFWTNKLNNKTESRGGVMAQFSESSEYKRKIANEVTVSVLNLLLLRRQVPQAEFDAAVARLDAPGGDTGDLATELLSSAIYRNRFS